MEQIISPAEALPGRSEAMVIGQQHAVNGHPTQGPWPENMAIAWFGMGCFWGVERLVLAAAWGLLHRRRLSGRRHPQSHLQGGVQRPDRSCRDGAGGV